MAKQKNPDLDQIIKYLKDDTGEVKISEAQKRKLERWDFADNLIRNYSNTDTIVSLIKSKFDVSRSTAHRDISAAKRAFASVNKIEKEYWRNIAIEWTIDSIRTAKENKDLKSKIAAEANFIKLMAFDKNDPDVPAFEHLKQHTYNIVADVTVLGIPKIENLEEIIAQFKKKKISRTIEINPNEQAQ